MANKKDTIKQGEEEKQTQKKQTRYDMKMERRRQQELKRQRNRKITIAVAVIVVLAIVAAIASRFYGKYQEANGPYITVGDHEISRGEFDYYYNNSYYSYLNTYGNYISYFGLDTSKPLDQQQYSDTQTWKDYFEEQAVNQIKLIYALKDAGEAEGFTHDSAQEVEDALQTVKSSADSADVKLADYLKQQFGEYMSEDKFKGYVEDSSYAGAYYEKIDGEISVSEDEITDYYNENKANYDSVDFLQCTINADIPETEEAAPAETEASASAETDETAETETETMSEEESEALEAEKEAAREAAMNEAKAQAEKMVAEASGKEAFLAAYEKYASDPEATAEHIQVSKSTIVPAQAGEWLFDDARQAGDVEMFENADGDSYEIFFFEDRYLVHEKTVKMRHILLQYEEEEAAEETEAAAETEETGVSEEEKAAVKAEAEKIYQEWKDGDASEDSFAELANTYSEDTGSNTNGGLYEAVYNGRMVDSINQWLFDDARKAGDTELIESEYGWHIVYFVGEDAERWQVNIKDLLHSNKIEEKITGLTDGLEVVDKKGVLNYLKAQETETETGSETETVQETETAK